MLKIDLHAALVEHFKTTNVRDISTCDEVIYATINEVQYMSDCTAIFDFLKCDTQDKDVHSVETYAIAEQIAEHTEQSTRADALKRELTDVLASVRENFRDVRSDDIFNDNEVISEARLIIALEQLLSIYDSDMRAYVID